jgi:hypothetical protein
VGAITNDPRAPADEGFQPAFALLQRQRLKVLAVEGQEVEREKSEAAPARAELLQPLEARAPALVEDDHLAVEHRGRRASSIAASTNLGKCGV